MINSLSNFHIGITGADTWTDLDRNITFGRATVLANFAGHVHGYYDPEKAFSSMDFSDAGTALAWQEDHPVYNIRNSPYFYNASYDYNGSQFLTAGGISVITTEAMMVGSNTNMKNGIIRIVSLVEDSFSTWTPEDTAFPSLNPYIIGAKKYPRNLLGGSVDFVVYAFTKMFSIYPIEYRLYINGTFRGNNFSSSVECIWFRNQELNYGTYEVNITVSGCGPGGVPVSESIKRTVEVGRATVHLKCPVDIVVTDPLGRSVGRDVNEIPGATYTEACLDGDGDLEKFVDILAPIDGNYVFTLNGTDMGLYSMMSQFVTSQEVVSFNATEIPSSLGAVDQYTVDWAALSRGEEGVIVNVDSNSDGVFEYNFTSDNELNRFEYVNATTKHDLAITGINPSKTIIGEGYGLPVNTTIMNYGAYTEIFNVTVYVNTTLAVSQIVTLTSGNWTVINCTLNTAELARGNYTISSIADILPDEVYTIDNSLTSGWVTVTIAGDVTSVTPDIPDYIVDMRDIGALCNNFMATPFSPDWNPNCDINGDGAVNMRDIGIACNNFGKR